MEWNGERWDDDKTLEEMNNDDRMKISESICVDHMDYFKKFTNVYTILTLVFGLIASVMFSSESRNNVEESIIIVKSPKNYSNLFKSILTVVSGAIHSFFLPEDERHLRTKRHRRIPTRKFQNAILQVKVTLCKQLILLIFTILSILAIYIYHLWSRDFMITIGGLNISAIHLFKGLLFDNTVKITR
ncbi:hypothetical protein ABEB36_009743 [Hypothenemus hampei]|uniref:Uncharacterized protein n=1 Tax=Hypothenemus hampei TaxID=57062 RepID=A0ABD1EHB5_HYPHA